MRTMMMRTMITTIVTVIVIVVFLFRPIVQIQEPVIIIRRIHAHDTYNVVLHQTNSITHHVNAFRSTTVLHFCNDMWVSQIHEQSTIEYENRLQ